jgi:hypothetical protein
VRSSVGGLAADTMFDAELKLGDSLLTNAHFGPFEISRRLDGAAEAALGKSLSSVSQESRTILKTA